MKSQHKHYRQLTQGRRYQIEALHCKGFFQRSIAEAIGVHPSSISRELRRNSSQGVYCTKDANRLKDNRKIITVQFNKCDESPAKIFRNGLLMGWSPENMSARMRKAGRSMIPGRVDISQRRKIVESRSRLGDWEGDTVYGQDASLVTLVERPL